MTPANNRSIPFFKELADLCRKHDVCIEAVEGDGYYSHPTLDFEFKYLDGDSSEDFTETWEHFIEHNAPFGKGSVVENPTITTVYR